jgi:hypothetical protein
MGPEVGMPTVCFTRFTRNGDVTMIIGIDPHKNSHTATALDPTINKVVDSLRIDATLAGYRQLLRWAAAFLDRRWAIENARGLGRRLAQWLVARDQTVLDVSTAATARVRELSRGGRRKNDMIDASAAASVAALHGDAMVVTGEDHTTVFAMLEERRANLAAQRVRAANQLHALLRDLIPAMTAAPAKPQVSGPDEFSAPTGSFTHACCALLLARGSAVSSAVGVSRYESSLCQGDVLVGLRARVIEPSLGRRLLRSVVVGPGVTSPKSRP